MNKASNINCDKTAELDIDIGLDTVLSLPPTITEHDVLGKHLIIAPRYASWLVYDDHEYEMFCFLRSGKNIRDAQELFATNRKASIDRSAEIASRVISQIYGKEFLRDVVVDEKQVFRTASIHLTEGCNLRCKTCLWSATIAGLDECSVCDWKKFLLTLRDFGGRSVAFNGGEPLLYRDHLEVMQYATDLGFRVALLTNGTLIDKAKAQALATCCNEIQISIDGPNAEVHESIRGKGTFEKAVSAMRDLSAYPQLKLFIAMTPTPDTFPYFLTGLGSFVDWVRINISPNINFRVTRDLLAGREIVAMTSKEQEKFRRDVVAMCDNQLGQDFILKLDVQDIVPCRRIFGCGIAQSFLVRANGDIELCSYFSKPLHNIRGTLYGPLIFSEFTGKLKQIISFMRVEKLKPCRECDLRYFCGGKCRKYNRIDCGNPCICECDDSFKEEWYERLVCASPYVVEPLEVIERR